MRIKVFLAILLLSSVLAAEDLEKTQKKALEAQVKTMTKQAEQLEKSGHLAEARTMYTESQALIEMKDVTEAIKHLDEEIRKRVKDALNDSRKLYESRKFTESAAVLDEAMKLNAYQAVLAFDLALCYHQLGESDKALEYLRKAKTGTVEPKQRQRLLQLLTVFTTGAAEPAVNDSDKVRIVQVNRLAESIGLEASLEDDGEAEEPSPQTDASSGQSAAAATLKTSGPANSHSNASASHRSSLCNALGELKANLANRPSATFDLANCAESNGRTNEAVKMLEQYLELAPKAEDAHGSRSRIADLKELLTLPAPNGVEVRRLYASAYGDLSEREYDRALAAFTKSSELAPDFALTKWKLALLYEAMGNTDQARENFTRYKQLVADQSAKDDADLHLSTLDAKRAKYNEEVDAAGDIVADLFNRALNLTWNASEGRSALRAKRARVKKKDDQGKARGRVGGFAIPFAYAQQQLGRASEHLQVALALFPLGAEANELMGLVFLQANDGHAAIKSFDVVASQGLPVAFYAELRGHKQDRAVKCELSRDHLRLVFLSSYDKNGKPAPPSKPAGEDGLGDLVRDVSDPPQQPVDSLDVTLSEIKKVETDKGMLKVKFLKEDIWLSPIYLPSFTPIEGPQARRFANNYTRLFVRYPGLEDSKLGAEGMSGGEKFKMGYNIANASMDIAMGGFGGIGAIASVQDVITIARTIQAAKVSLNVSFATWEKTVDDQQQLLAGKAFKSITTEPANLTFVQETK